MNVLDGLAMVAEYVDTDDGVVELGISGLDELIVCVFLVV